MSYLLLINTALETASVSLAKEGRPGPEKKLTSQREHASFLHTAMSELVKIEGISLKELSAVGVIAGPGSYTGLRVGLSAAKGICFALNLPLITVNTLEWMANSAKNEQVDLLCPMIDARRMEVFTATFNRKLDLVAPPSALILDEKSFSDELKGQKILFFGSGSQKFSTLISHPNALFKSIEPGAESFTEIAWNLYQKEIYADLAYTEPLYVKDFYTTFKG